MKTFLKIVIIIFVGFALINNTISTKTDSNDCSEVNIIPNPSKVYEKGNNEFIFSYDGEDTMRLQKYINQNYLNKYDMSVTITNSKGHVPIIVTEDFREEWNGYYDTEDREIYIKPNRLYKATIVHEILHALGLDDMDGVGSNLMQMPKNCNKRFFLNKKQLIKINKL